MLRRHYHEDTGLLPLGNLGGPGWRGLADQLVACLQPLALLPFRLDFLYQPRQLAARLTLSPPAQQQQKQWSLRGLVRSIHSSLSVSTSEDSKDSPLPDIVGSSKVGTYNLVVELIFFVTYIYLLEFIRTLEAFATSRSVRKFEKVSFWLKLDCNNKENFQCKEKLRIERN